MWKRDKFMEAINAITVTAKLLSLFCFVSVMVVTISPLRFSWLTRLNLSDVKFNYTVPIVELQSKITSSDRHNHHHFRVVGSAFATNMLRNKTLVLRKAIKLSKEEKIELGLAKARASILTATTSFRNSLPLSTNDDVPYGSIYRNPSTFYRSYMEMEKRFKVYVYTEGDPPIAHDGPCKSIYTIEGRFIHEMERWANRFRTRDPNKAHVFFLPFSVTWMVKYIHKPLSRDMSPLRQFVADYVKVVSTKYPYWNRTHGADHFMLACHDWGPHVSQGNSLLFNTSIRVLCNANTSEGFNPQKDVSLPEIYLYGGVVSPKLKSPPPLNSRRRFLAFFAGGVHGPIRPILLQHWNNSRDPDIHVSEYLPEGLDYYDFMLKSMFCLCPSGYEVASPRIVEAIYAECVPVILSENYVLPFSDVLRWDAFSIQVDVSDIPRLKDVLRAIPEEKYLRLKEGLRAVRKHFVLNRPAKRFDVFHMILHSVWLRRINMSTR